MCRRTRHVLTYVELIAAGMGCYMNTLRRGLRRVTSAAGSRLCLGITPQTLSPLSLSEQGIPRMSPVHLPVWELPHQCLPTFALNPKSLGSEQEQTCEGRNETESWSRSSKTLMVGTANRNSPKRLLRASTPVTQKAPGSRHVVTEEYRLQVRLFDGSSVRSSFSPLDTIHDGVRPWLDRQCADGTCPYTLKHILTRS